MTAAMTEAERKSEMHWVQYKASATSAGLSAD